MTAHFFRTLLSLLPPATWTKGQITDRRVAGLGRFSSRWVMRLPLPQMPRFAEASPDRRALPKHASVRPCGLKNSNLTTDLASFLPLPDNWTLSPQGSAQRLRYPLARMAAWGPDRQNLTTGGQAMRTNQLGNSDLFITPIGFGAWAIGGSGWEFAWGVPGR